MVKQIAGLFGMFWLILREYGKKFSTHRKKVNETRYCKCCGALASYYATTVFCSATQEELTVPLAQAFGVAPPTASSEKSLITKHTPRMYLCKEHHPFHGTKLAETWQKLEVVHKKLTFDLITPNPFM